MPIRIPMRLIELQEHSLTRGVQLAGSEVQWLRRMVPSVRITSSSKNSGNYDLKPRSTVGTVTVDGLQIRIHPKLSVKRLLFLVAYSSRPNHWQAHLATFGEVDDLVEAVAFGFVHQLRRVLRHGLLQGYRTRDETMPGLRGRLRAEDQIRRHQGRCPPAEARYDEFSEDVLENQILSAALHSLRRLPIRSQALRHNLRALEQTFTNISNTEFRPQGLPAIHPTPLNRRYLPALELALRILRSTSFDQQGTDIRARGFLIDMNGLFEEFVVTALREALGVPEFSFPKHSRSRGLTLDEAGKIPLYPDLTWWHGSRLRFVGDAKYKITRGKGKREDLYQLLSYAIAAGLPEAWLIYAEGPPSPTRHRIRHAGRALRVEALNLNVEPSTLLAQIKGIAKEIAETARS